MEKRKDIDMLRFYGGDIHQKNKEQLLKNVLLF